jgi:hypothetical protein
MKRFTSFAAAVFTAAFLAAATSVSAQDSNIDQRTFLTFSGPVQMPGITLPAGKYVFKLAPTALHNVMQVFDGEEKHIIGQWFFVPVERTNEEQAKADGKPVVMFREMPEGVTPAVHYFYYPTDLRGKEFIYPKEQALKIAAATHETVLATDTDVEKGGEAHVFKVEPEGATASTTNTEPSPAKESSTASLNSQSDLNNSPASGPPAPAQQAVGTSGQNPEPAPAPRQQASSQLPKTASPYSLIGLLGLLSLAGGFGLRLARTTY